MSRLCESDIQDELVSPYLEDHPEMLEQADDFLDDLIKSFDRSRGIEDVPDPMPFKVKRLAVAYVCYQVCLIKASTTTVVAYEGQTSNDKWAMKLSFWRKEYEKLEDAMSLTVIIGTATKQSKLVSVRIGRC